MRTRTASGAICSTDASWLAAASRLAVSLSAAQRPPAYARQAQSPACRRHRQPAHATNNKRVHTTISRCSPSLPGRRRRAGHAGPASRSLVILPSICSLPASCWRQIPESRRITAAIAVLEVGADGGYVLVVDDAVQRCVIVDEGVLPADDMAPAIPVLHQGWYDSRREHDGSCASPSARHGPEDFQLVEPFRSKRMLPFAVDSGQAHSCARRQASRLQRADGAVLELDRGHEGVYVHSAHAAAVRLQASSI